MILHRGGGIQLYTPNAQGQNLILSKRLSPSPFPDSRCCGNCFEMYRILLVALLSFSCWLSDRLAPHCFSNGFIGEMRDWSMIFSLSYRGMPVALCGLFCYCENPVGSCGQLTGSLNQFGAQDMNYEPPTQFQLVSDQILKLYAKHVLINK